MYAAEQLLTIFLQRRRERRDAMLAVVADNISLEEELAAAREANAKMMEKVAKLDAEMDDYHQKLLGGRMEMDQVRMELGIARIHVQSDFIAMGLLKDKIRTNAVALALTMRNCADALAAQEMSTDDVVGLLRDKANTLESSTNELLDWDW